LQGEDCDLRGAVEAKGKAYGADAAVDVELHLVEAVVAFGVFLAHRRQDQGAEEGKPDLTAMRVAGEHEVDESAARVRDDRVGVVGFVGHENDRSIGFSGDCEIEVGVAGAWVVDAAEPQVSAAALDGKVLVDENWSAVGVEGGDDSGAVVGDVMIAEACVAEGWAEIGEDLGAAMNRVPARDEGEGAVRDEVAGKEDEVGGECVDFVDDALEEE
jgi:hypothetical protein